VTATVEGSARTEAVSHYLQALQARITSAIADIDGHRVLA